MNDPTMRIAMDIRINKPKEIKSQTLYLVIHGGYDFDPTVLAVCSTKESAELMLEEHYNNWVPYHLLDSENKDFPWNTCIIVETMIDNWVPYHLLDKEYHTLKRSVE